MKLLPFLLSKIAFQSPIEYNDADFVYEVNHWDGCNSIKSVPETFRFNQDGFYEKYTSVYGIPIVSSGSVDDEALQRSCRTVHSMLADRNDVRLAFNRMLNARVVVLGKEDIFTNIPEYSHLKNSTVDCETTYDETVRGFAGTQKNPVTVASEEYVLCEGDSKRDMLMHQFAKSIYLIGASSIDNQFRPKLKRAYHNAIERKLWQGTLAQISAKDYFAVGAQAYFRNNQTRHEFSEYDSELYALVKQIFPCGNFIDPTCKGDSANPQIKYNCEFDNSDFERSEGSGGEYIEWNPEWESIWRQLTNQTEEVYQYRGEDDQVWYDVTVDEPSADLEAR